MEYTEERGRLYYGYAGPYKNRDKAEEVLDDMFSAGDVCEAEAPFVRQQGGKYYVFVPAA